MIVIFVRTVIIFITLMVVMRLMGKRQIGEMQSFELVITLIIADLACIPMADVSIPLTYGLVSILALFILHQLMSVLERLGNFSKKIISGKPSVVVNKTGIDFFELKRNNLSVTDLLESLRNNGCFFLGDVEYAIFESNGKLSCMQKDERIGKSISLLIIEEGKINYSNLKNLGKDEKWLYEQTLKYASDIKSVCVLTVDGEGLCYLQVKDKNFCYFNVDLEVKW